MTITSIFVLLVIMAFNSIVCNEPKNMEEIEDSEDWESITDAICKTNHSNNIKDQIEKCNQLDSYYKFDSLTKECEKLKAPSGSNWYEEQKGECRYNECYDKLSKSKEFHRLESDADNLSEETRIKKGFDKYKCIRKALGLKA